MVTIIHEADIKAPAEKIWQILWNDGTYRKWASCFSEGCYYESDWQVGGKTLFLDSTGKNGMLSTIETLNPPFEVVFKHLGSLKDGEEVFNTKEVAEWSGAQEKYILTEFPGYTKLTAKTQAMQEYEDYMKNAFHQAFEKIKELAESE